MNYDMFPFAFALAGLCIVGIAISLRELLSGDRKTFAELLKGIDPDETEEE